MAVREMVSSFAPPKVIGEIRYTGAAQTERECADFRNFWMPAQQPARPGSSRRSHGTFARHRRGCDPQRILRHRGAYLAAVGRALQVEYEAIVARGFLLQLDCPDLALEHHISFQDRPQSDFLDFVERVVATINEALRNIPRDKVRMHVCWGNYEGPHDRDVPLATILPLIARMNVGALVLPFANPRHAHEVRCLEDDAISDDQIVVAGVIDSLTNFVEHPEVIAEQMSAPLRHSAIPAASSPERIAGSIPRRRRPCRRGRGVGQTGGLERRRPSGFKQAVPNGLARRKRFQQDP